MKESGLTMAESNHKITKNVHSLTSEGGFTVTVIVPAEAQCPTQKGQLHWAARKSIHVLSSECKAGHCCRKDVHAQQTFPRINKGFKKTIQIIAVRDYRGSLQCGPPICVVRLPRHQQTAFCCMSAAKMRATAI